MKKLKILGILPFNRLWSAGTGGTPTVYNLLKGFIDAGHEVHLVCLFDKKENISLEGLYVHRFKLPFSNLKSNIKLLNVIYSKILYFLFILLATRKAFEVTREMKPDIVYGFASFGAPAAYIIGRIKHIPNITRLYGTFLHPFIHSRLQLLLRFDETLAFKIPCKYLIITNDGTKGDEVAKRLKVPAERIKFWMNGVDDIYDPSFDTEKFRESIGIPKNKKIVLSVSRLVGWKKVDRIINAVPSVVSQYKNVVFLIVGDGEERMNLENLVNKLNVEDYVRFIGATPYNEVKYYMNTADVFVSSNDLTNICNPLLEAMRCGRGILTLNTGATGEILKNNENGILLDIDEIYKMSDALLNLLNDEKLRRTLGMNAREYASRYFQTWDERIQMEIKAIEKICYKDGEK